jgi:hypothetical protein
MILSFKISDADVGGRLLAALCFKYPGASLGPVPTAGGGGGGGALMKAGIGKLPVILSLNQRENTATETSQDASAVSCSVRLAMCVTKMHRSKVHGDCVASTKPKFQYDFAFRRLVGKVQGTQERRSQPIHLQDTVVCAFVPKKVTCDLCGELFAGTYEHSTQHKPPVIKMSRDFS